MTGLGVERLMRAAYPSPSVSLTAASMPLPPHIQGAERQRSRWGLRLLVIGGLAGAAWLLTGSAAQAADWADEPSGSLLGAVLGGDATAPVTDLLAAAAQPLETGPAHQHHAVADILEVPQRVLTHSAETVNEIARGGIENDVDAGPRRLTGGSAPDQKRIGTQDNARPATEQPLLEPVDEPVQVEAPPTPVAQPNRVRLTKALRAPAPAALRSGTAVRHVKATTSAPVAHRNRHVTAHAVVAVPEVVREGTPGGPAAPLQLHLGDVSGTPTTGSGTPTEGGSAAFLPAAIASSTMACQRLPIASDVEVRRYDAEAPTVSPD
ncbi:hypothetical protein Ate02nite_76340 [Paractinoplanes tereljensis]|uniref:Uncharacterized protein n=2 Tax=Paractinoplanes tereljensis TaxID=571912 RepID=A0A919TX21_9ACTN|nr:hypothetical protein Ate02nite_76340 [Actinoplanes tereljensis]